MVRTSTFRWNPAARESAIAQVEVAEEVPGLRQGDVPHYPLGSTHPEYADENKLPFEATLGGKETLYPGVRREAEAEMRQADETQ